MTQLCRKIVHVNIKWSLLERVSVFRQFFSFFGTGLCLVLLGNLSGTAVKFRSPEYIVEDGIVVGALEGPTTGRISGYSTDSDLVPLKISLLGDCQIGKTSFVARAYAKAMKATLFFSSAKHNINVNKIFKFIMVKLFNLPWTVERNLTLGEPIIDF